MTRAVWHLAINSLAGRPGRSALLALAIATATALVVAVAAMTGTIQASLRMVVAQTTGLADLRVKHRFNGRIDPAVVSRVNAWPEVDAVSPLLEAAATLHSPFTSRTVEVIVQGRDPHMGERFHPTRLLMGRTVRYPNEIVMDDGVAARLGLAVGDMIEITGSPNAPVAGSIADLMLGNPTKGLLGALAGTNRKGDTLRFEIVGLVDRPRLRILQRPTVVVTLDQAQILARAQGKVDSIDVLLKPRYEPTDVETKHRADLGNNLEFRSTAGGAAGARKAIAGSRVILLLISLLVFLSAGFIIMTSMTASVIERMKELAVLRCIGAGRGTIATSQLLSGALLATIAALVGAPIGLGLSYLLYRHYASSLIAGFSPDWLGVAGAIGASSLAGLAGGVYPAIRASRVRPLQALASRAVRPTTRGIVLCMLVGLACASVQPIVLSLPLDTDTALWAYLYAGMPLTFIGYFLVSVPVFFVLAKLAAPVISRVFVIPDTLLGESAAATPYRHGLTAGALMVALAMLVGIWTGGRSVMGEWFESIRMPDGFLARMGTQALIPITDSEWDAINSVKGVRLACPTAAFPVKMRGNAIGTQTTNAGFTLFVSFDPDSFLEMTSLTWVQGDPDTALPKLKRGGAVLVSREFLVARKIGLGSTLTLETADGPRDFEVAGVIASPGLDVAVQYFGINRYYSQASVSSVFGSRADAAKYFEAGDARTMILMSFDNDVPDKDIMKALSKAVPGSVSSSARQIRAGMKQWSNRFMAVASTLATGALLVASFGVGNLIVAGVIARRHEFGVLRAIGAQRWLPARLTFGEVTLMALAACVCGTTLGIHLALISRVFHGRILGLSYAVRIPWDVVALGSAEVIALALLAAIPAAWRLARAQPRAMLGGE